jgi:predicted P-loop ATPase
MIIPLKIVSEEIRWPATNNGMPVKNHPKNLRYLIDNVLQMKLRYNELAKKTEVNGEGITDFHLSQVRNACRECRLSDNNVFVEDTILLQAKESSYHPFKEKVESVQWDGEDHISALLDTIKIAEGFEQHREVYAKYLRRWLIGVIAKVYSPGSQNMMLVLQGGQGIGKSRWTKKLGLIDSAYGEGAVDPDNKDHELRHLNKVVWNIPELDAVTSKRDISALKDYLTKEEISVRAAYARFNTEGSSTCSFMGSVNGDAFLRDTTGNRRFLIIPVESIDNDTVLNMQQVYAQAFVAKAAGEIHWFEKEDIAQTEELNVDFEEEHPIMYIASYVQPGKTKVTLDRIVSWYGYERGREINSIERKLLGKYFKRRGIKSARETVNGIKVTFYFVADHSGLDVRRIVEGKEIDDKVATARAQQDFANINLVKALRDAEEHTLAVKPIYKADK